ncbi:MAG: hypothetical protein L3J39_16570 [Verrucomicrobiales bacterium]|nr:hypothetical protein [Verrucomicrobiales bacterium]
MVQELPEICAHTMTSMLEELELGITKYPQALREIYQHGREESKWTQDEFGVEPSGFDGLSMANLAAAHQLMYASAFAASAACLPGWGVPPVAVPSTSILDVITDAGLPPREFLRQYGKYGNQFTWKLLKLTGRISESKYQPAPNLKSGG